MSEASQTPDAVPEIRIEARIRRVGDALIVAGSAQEALELTDAAVLAFRQIDGRRTIREISRTTAQTYEVDSSVVQEDIVEVFAGLAEAGVITLKV